MSKILDGKALAQRVRGDLKNDIAALTPKLGRPPGLAVVLVGEDPASAIYVRSKEKGAAEIGMYSRVVRLGADASQADIIGAVDALNADSAIDGMIVQLPLPQGVDARAVLLRVDPSKDADGLHPQNLGMLAAGNPAPRACTPMGCMRLIDEAGIELEGAHAVVIGRSTIVGKPMALMLLERNATVTMCHSRTKNLEDEVRRADVVVAAVGKRDLVRGSWIKQGAVVIDVGMNRIAPKKVVGDVEFAVAAERAGAITPVPGGVGPMTVAMLLANTVAAAQRRLAQA